MTPVRTLSPDQLNAEQLERWRDLAAGALDPNPFYESDFLIPAAAHLRVEGLQLLVSEPGDAWRGCVPVVVERWRPGLPALIAWHGLHAYLCSPLLDTAHFDDTLGALLREASRLAGRRMIVVERLGSNERLASALDRATDAAGRTVVGRAVVGRALLRRRPDGDYLGHMRPHHVREAKRQRRRLEEALGAPLETTDRAGDEAAVERFLELERRGWKGREGTAFASSEGGAAFFREVCRRFAASGRLQLLELAADERPVAMKCNLLAGEGAFAFKIAFDEEFSRYSPGIQLELDNIRVFHDSGLSWMDSCADPDNQMINRLWSDRRRVCTVVLARHGAAAAATRLVFALGLRLRQRRHPEWTRT